jgi:DNA-binding response OmpR family regulator
MTIEPCLLLAVGHPVLRALLVEQITAADLSADPALGRLPPIVTAPDAAAALEAAAAPVAAVVLDDAIDGDCEPLAPRLREAGIAGPILRIAEDASAPGVDAHVARPVHMPTLLSLLRGGLAGGRSGQAALPSVGRWRFDSLARSLSDPGSGAEIRLTAKEAQILDRLLAAAGGIVTRERLLADVWRYAVGVATHTVETHVYRLRRKLAGGEGMPPIETAPGGWRLVV